MKSLPHNCNDEKFNKSATKMVEQENIDLLLGVITFMERKYQF